MTRRTWIAVAIGVALLGVAVTFFLLAFERVEEEIETGPGPAARANPYLAAERLLGRMGLTAESVRGPMRLPPTDHVLLLLTSRRTIGPERTRWLLDWVDRGGHLIVTPKSLPEGDESEDGEAAPAKEEPDPLFAALVLTVDRSGEGEAEVLGLATTAGEATREVSVARSPRLVTDEGEPDFTDGHGVLARYRRGEGRVTVLADVSALSNDAIGDHEHARFLWSLVTTPVAPAGVWLVYRDRMPGLRHLLVKRAWMALVAGALALAVWLWYRGARFGPLIEAPASGRRSLREHLEATAEFLWRQGKAASLIESQRQAVMHAVRRQHPSCVDLAHREQIKYLAELSGVAGGALARALEGRVTGEPGELTRVIETLEKVRRSL